MPDQLWLRLTQLSTWSKWKQSLAKLWTDKFKFFTCTGGWPGGLSGGMLRECVARKILLSSRPKIKQTVGWQFQRVLNYFRGWPGPCGQVGGLKNGKPNWDGVGAGLSLAIKEVKFPTRMLVFSLLAWPVYLIVSQGYGCSWYPPLEHQGEQGVEEPGTYLVRYQGTHWDTNKKMCRIMEKVHYSLAPPLN